VSSTFAFVPATASTYSRVAVEIAAHPLHQIQNHAFTRQNGARIAPEMSTGAVKKGQAVL